MGEGVRNDRLGFTDSWGRNLAQLREAPRDVRVNPLAGPNMKQQPPFLVVDVGGRHYLGDPWRSATGRIVLPDTGLTSVAAQQMAVAEQIASAESAALAILCSYRVPPGMVGIATRIRVRFRDNTALEHVKLSLLAGSDGANAVAQSGDQSMVVSGEKDFFLALDSVLEVNFRTWAGKTIKLVAETKDSEAPHLVEGMMEGVCFPTSIIGAEA